MNQTPGNPSEPPVLEQVLCQTCGASCDKHRSNCWMCGRPPTEANPYAIGAGQYPPTTTPEAVVAAPVRSKYNGLFTVLLMLCFTLALLLGVGLGIEEPGSLIAYLILIGPAFGITGIRALVQLRSTGKTNSKSLFISLAISFAVTIAVIAILIAALLVLLFALCFYELSKA